MKLRKIASFLFIFTALMACEKIEILPAPDFDEGCDDPEGCVDPPKTGTGNSDARGMIFIQNGTPSRNIDPASLDFNVVTTDVLEYLSNDEFAKPDPSDFNRFNFDVFPNITGNHPPQSDAIGVGNILQEVPADRQGRLEPSTFVGAFDRTVQAEWYVNSNWFVMDPQFIDYGYDPNTVVVIDKAIESDMTWTRDKKYILNSQIFVRPGAKLTIEPGTVIFGRNDIGTAAGVLVINRGARLIAEGTPDEPIIFTSTTAPGERSRGEWGGIVFLGRAPNSKAEDVLIEGIQPIEEGDGEYGGNDLTDNSGVFAFVRVEFAGVALSPGNEINSVTLGSVGNGTTIHHTIVSYAGDDGYEWFGGDVDGKYMITFNVLDDDFDLDQGFSGNLQYLYSVRYPYSADESNTTNFEVSASRTEGVLPNTNAVVFNATTVGFLYQLSDSNLLPDPKYLGGLFSKDFANVRVFNSIFIGAPTGIQNP